MGSSSLNKNSSLSARPRSFSPIQYDPENPGSPDSDSGVSESFSIMTGPTIMPAYDLVNKGIYDVLYEALIEVDEALRVLKFFTNEGQFTWFSIEADINNGRRLHSEQLARFWDVEKKLIHMLFISEAEYNNKDKLSRQDNFSKLKKDHGETKDLHGLHAGYTLLVKDFINQAEDIPAQAGTSYQRGTTAETKVCENATVWGMPFIFEAYMYANAY